ncbi:probable ATP-dependent helicase PF08_0048 isoform X2 [Lytechinus variegatus]|uniref:probable ATP-dependent helicase PF08_0048 isoform X2 n=1 Tax=Lytechinus variegatus TaxID=7654 RepID=UPI001BB26639|nr:probable ATP-dependent helicase PF08_0048 isoform X2 [Lytechinus variegatus]
MAGNEKEFCNISSILFTDKDCQPLVFCIRPSATRARLKILIESGGGKVTSRLDPSDTNVIKILADGDKHSSPEYLIPSFVDDCVAANTLLDKYSYRVPSPTEDQSTVVSDVTAKGRSYYSPAEDEAILQYIAKHPFQYSGNKIWKRMELMKITNHSWQSMRDHFLKKLEGRLRKYTKKREENLKKYVHSDTKVNDEDQTESNDEDIMEEETTPNSAPMLAGQNSRGNSDPEFANGNMEENEHSDASSFDMDLFQAANEDLERKSFDENQRVQEGPPVSQDHIVRRSARHSKKQTQDSAQTIITRSKRAEMQEKEVQSDKKIDTRRKIGRNSKLKKPEANIDDSIQTDEITDANQIDVVDDGLQIGQVDDGNQKDEVDEGNEIDGMDDSNQIDGVDNCNEIEGVVDGNKIDGVDDGNQIEGVDDSNEMEGVDDGNEIDGVDDGNQIDGVDNGNQINEDNQLDGHDESMQRDEVEDDVFQIGRNDGDEETTVQQRNTMITSMEIIDGIGNDYVQPEELDVNKSIRSRKRNLSSPPEPTVVHLLSTKKKKTPVKTPLKLDTNDLNEPHVEESRTFSRQLRGPEIISDSSASDDATSDVLPMKRTRLTANTEMNQPSDQAMQVEEQMTDYIKLKELCTKYRQTKLEICTALYVCSGDFTIAEKYLESGPQPDICIWSNSQDRLLLSSSPGQDISSSYSRTEASHRLLWLKS